MNKGPEEIVYIQTARGRMEPEGQALNDRRRRQERIDWIWDKSGPWILPALGLFLLLLNGCAIERAQVAESAQTEMIGLSREQVLACMGPPGNRMAEGATEVWAYGSGDGSTSTVAFADGTTTGSVTGGPGYANFNAASSASAIAHSSRRYCIVNIVMTKGAVSRVSYAGPTGGLLTAGEQCAFAIRNCVKPR